MQDTVKILYTNWKGETTERAIQPLELWFGATEYHPEEQWLLRTLDIEKGEERNFATKDIKRWGLRMEHLKTSRAENHELYDGVVKVTAS